MGRTGVVVAMVTSLAIGANPSFADEPAAPENPYLAPAPAPAPAPDPAPSPAAPVPLPPPPPPFPLQTPPPAAEPAPEPAPEPAAPIATRSPVPLGRRGSIGVDAAAAKFDNTSTLTVDFAASIPIAGKIFVEAKMPVSVSGATFLGNPTLGGRYVMHLGGRTWLDLGGHMMLPFLGAGSFPVTQTNASPFVLYLTAGRGAWDVLAFLSDTFTLQANGVLEAGVGPLVLRFTVVPSLSVRIKKAPLPFGSEDNYSLTLPHAVEVQSAGAIGGGGRIQGVILPERISRLERYQLAFEPYFFVERKSAFFRLGVLVPVDDPLSVFNNGGMSSWSVKLAAGMRLE